MGIGQTSESAPAQVRAANARIAVLLASFNGAGSLARQLDSIAAQVRQPDLILISDDGSTDATRGIINAFTAARPELDVRLLEGPRQGAARNFMSLIAATPPEIDMIAFCDQDDVWLRGKLARGCMALSRAADSNVPVLYCGRTWECSAELTGRRLSRMPRRGTDFRNALVQNVASGNTIMVNRGALDLLRAAAAETEQVVVHDWWVYQMITGVGGRVIFDTVPGLLYRQHRGNLIGANRGLRAKWVRLRMMWTGKLRLWNTVNIRALSASSARLTPENAALLADFAAARNGTVFERVALILRAGLYRQGPGGQLSLYVAAVFGKL